MAAAPRTSGTREHQGAWLEQQQALSSAGGEPLVMVMLGGRAGHGSRVDDWGQSGLDVGRQVKVHGGDPKLLAQAQLKRVDHAGAGAAGARVGDLEPRQDRAGSAGLVSEVEVVGERIVEVDRLLDEAQP